MVKVTDKQYYMDGYLQSNMNIYKSLPGQDWDVVGVIDGTEGGGKSVMAQQIAYYLDPTFNLNRIVFRHAEFRRAVLDAKRCQAVIWDEALSGLNSKTSMQLINITICDLLAEIRQKNLFIIIVLPTFFDLVKYVALWRSRFLINVYHDKFQRGFFSFYNDKSKRFLYVHGKKVYNYSVGKPNFRGRFTNHYTVDEQAYRDKKLSSLRATDETIISDSVKRYREHLSALLCFMKKTGYTTKDLTTIFDQHCSNPINIRTVHRLLKEKMTPDTDRSISIDLHNDADFDESDSKREDTTYNQQHLVNPQSKKEQSPNQNC